MRTFVLIGSLLPHLIAATPLVERAGGPAIEPIPTNCTIVNLLPYTACGTRKSYGYQPNPDFVKKALLHEAYFNSSGDDDAEQCIQQCYGYGNGECKSYFFGNRVPIPAGYHGVEEGEFATACLLFSEHVNPDVFVQAPEGRYQDLMAANINCPES